MKLIRPLYALAIALIAVSSLTSQSFAQDDVLSFGLCEELTAAVEARGNATIVSGIQIEEAVTQELDPESVENSVTPLAIQILEADADRLTLPAGTIERFQTQENFDSISQPFPFNAGDELSFAFPVPTIDGTSTEIVEVIFPGFLTEEFSFQPDPNLGDAIGFCLPIAVAEEIATSEIAIRVFDGDTVIGEIELDGFLTDTTFLAQPGQTITRIDFIGLVIFTDFQVAFATGPPVPTVVSNQECFENIAVEVGELADAATDSYDAYALNVASAALSFSAQGKFYEEDGNRLSRLGGNVFTGAAYAISYLEHTGVEGTEDIVDRIIDKLDQIVDEEIAFAIENGGAPQFIERAEELAEVAEWIDNDLDNPVVATIAYKLAWANAFFSTY